jgi:predicted ATPase/class 3 adenylate cyclase
MAEPRTLPRGTLTFLFTDIEGSTTLERTIGRDRYAALLARHREIARAVWSANGGRELGTEGDSFFVFFQESWQAIAAAVAVQRALAAEPWPDDAPIRIRIGINTGDAEQSGDSYIGLGVNRAARIAAVAAGGQILVSGTTRDLYGDHPVDAATLRDLGEHRLKDLGAPVRIYQVETDGLATSFPPLRTLDARPNNLPTQLTTFVGRDAELDEAAALLERTRLLTLSGPGGTGKTRLSLELAARTSDDFPDGVYFVPLEPIRDPMLVAQRIAATVGIVESAARPIAESLADWLRDKRLLLVLDNFEQVIGAAPIVADLLRAAPHIKVVVTSRAILHVSGEQEYAVPGLPAPPDPSQQSGLERLNQGAQRHLDLAALGQYAAVRLFIDRAVAVRPGFAVTNENAPAVAAISARLHGMPLAIELAAARIKILSPDAILSRLDHQLDILASGSRDLPERQQTLRGAIAWSYELLEPGGRRLLDRLSIFRTGCDLATVEAVCGPPSEIGGDILDGLMALVDQSLLKVEETADGEPRFRLLDTIRAYAAEQLEANGELDRIQARHRDWYVTLVEQAAGELSGTAQRRWLDRLELEHDDIRAVLDRAVEVPDPPTAIGLAFDMWRFWQKHGHLAEARRRLEAMEASPWSRDDPRLRAQLLEALGGVHWWMGDVAAMAPCYREALAIRLEIGTDEEIANAYYNASFEFAVPAVRDGSDIESDADAIGLTYLERARDIYRRIGDLRGEANALWGIGNYHYFRGLEGNGVEQFRAALAMVRQTGDLTMEAWSLHMLGTSMLRNGDVAGAHANVAHAIRHFHAAGDAAGLTLTLDDMSAIAVAEGDLPRAARLRGAARNLTSETGAELAAYVEDTFETGVRPGIRSHMPAEDLARYGDEGAAMTLDETVAYALEGSDPAEPEA